MNVVCSSAKERATKAIELQYGVTSLFADETEVKQRSYLLELQNVSGFCITGNEIEETFLQ
jgi:hypothetical protein